MARKKYIIKESELKEIIKEMILQEVYNPDDFANNYTSEKGRQAAQNLTPGVLGKNALSLITGIPNAIVPDEWKERAQNGDNQALKWILGALGITTGGAVGADFVPNVNNLKMFGGSGLGKGNNPDAHEVFNVASAIKWLMNNASPYYMKNKRCAAYVRQALNAGGLSAPWGMMAGSAKDYINVLPANGWTEINVGNAGQPGDIIVIDAFTGHPYGHIAMCCGNGLWVSDFRQNTPFGINGRVPENKVHYYRYKNIG